MIRTLRTAAVALAIAGLAPAATLAAPVPLTVDPSHSSVTFSIRHFFTKVNGAFDKFTADISYDPDKPAASSLKATVDAASINTKNERRDTHLRSEDFFDAEHFPSLTFVSKKTTWKESAFTMEGDLTIRDVTLPVVFTGELTGYGKDNRGSTRAGFSAATTIDRTKFNLVWNKPWEGGSGAMLGNDVKILLDIEAVKSEPAATN